MSILFRPNTISRFNLTNTSYLLLKDFLSPFKLSAWIKLLKNNLEFLKIYLAIIFKLKTEIGYKSSQNILILLKNLVSIIKDLFIINNKFVKDIQLYWVIFVPIPDALFILSFLTFISKHDKRFRKIHHFSYFKKKSVNDYIPDAIKKLRYT